jgi:hypothetical protein
MVAVNLRKRILAALEKILEHHRTFFIPFQTSS